MIEHIRSRDIVVVWKLDRLGRSLRDLVNLISKFQEFGVGFKSLQDNIDTTTPTGKLTFHLFAALAEFERDIISERTKAGLTSARIRGRKGGRPKGLSKKAQDKARLAESLYKDISYKKVAISFTYLQLLLLICIIFYNLQRKRALIAQSFQRDESAETDQLP